MCCTQAAINNDKGHLYVDNLNDPKTGIEMFRQSLRLNPHQPEVELALIRAADLRRLTRYSSDPGETPTER